MVIWTGRNGSRPEKKEVEIKREERVLMRVSKCVSNPFTKQGQGKRLGHQQHLLPHLLNIFLSPNLSATAN